MKIKFKQYCELEEYSDICCFTGDYQKKMAWFNKDYELEIKDLYLNSSITPKPKRKSPKTYTIILNRENEDYLHPDVLVNVPKEYFEIINEPKHNDFLARRIDESIGQNWSPY